MSWQSQHLHLLTREAVLAAISAARTPPSTNRLCHSVFGGANRGPRAMMVFLHKLEAEGVIERVKLTGRGHGYRLRGAPDVD